MLSTLLGPREFPNPSKTGLPLADLQAIRDVTHLDSARSQLDDLRNRLGYKGRTLVVALAGGTGSGKSSLLNAIAGEAVASVSRLRPHTDEPMAWIPEDADAAVDQLLVTLGVDKAVRQDDLPERIASKLPLASVYVDAGLDFGAALCHVPFDEPGVRELQLAAAKEIPVPQGPRQQ